MTRPDGGHPIPWNQPLVSSKTNMTVTELVANGTVPIRIMISAEQNSPSDMKTLALLRSETLPMMNLDRP